MGYRHGITRIGSVWYGMVLYVTVLSPNRSWNSVDSTEVKRNIPMDVKKNDEL